MNKFELLIFNLARLGLPYFSPNPKDNCPVELKSVNFNGKSKCGNNNSICTKQNLFDCIITSLLSHNSQSKNN